MIITSRKSIFFWQIVYMNVDLCTSANTTSSYKNTIFGKLERVLYFQETFQLGPNIKIKKNWHVKKPTNFIICRFQNTGMADPQVCNTVAFWHWTILSFINIAILLAKVFRKWSLRFMWWKTYFLSCVLSGIFDMHIAQVLLWWLLLQQVLLCSLFQ